MYVKKDVAVELLKQGHVVGFMTDTVYGIAVIAPFEYKLYNLKKRSKSKKLIKLVDQYSGDVDVKLRAKMAVCWPGSTTFVFEENGGLESYRISGCSEVVELCKLVGQPLYTTSANISGEPTVDTDLEFFETFKKVGLVLFKNKPCKSNVASSILLYNRGKFRKLR